MRKEEFFYFFLWANNFKLQVFRGRNLNKFYFNNERKIYLRFIEISKKNLKAKK